MKLVKVVKKTDASTAFRKCDKWAQELYANSLNSLALPNYIGSYCKELDLHEAEDVLETLEGARDQFDRLLRKLDNVIKIVQQQG